MPTAQIIPKEFDLGDILSITTGILVSPRHMGGIYDILGYMTGSKLYMHQLPRAADACKPDLLKQYPQLNGVNASGINRENCRAWLDAQIKTHGAKLPIKPLLVYECKDPLQEAVERLGGNARTTKIDGVALIERINVGDTPR